MTIIITNAMKTEQLADALVSREHEVMSYQINIDNYTEMLKALPQDEWPANLNQHIETDPAKLPSEMSLVEALQVADYQYRDRLNVLIRTEHVEMNKVKRVKDAIDKQLPTVASDKATAINAAVTRRDAALAKAQ